MVVLNGVLPFFLILVGLVIAHELGHFVVAKLAGVRVEEFGVGMPPRVWGFRIGETLYSINLLPLGGFVKLTGEESAQLSVQDVNAHSPAHEAGVREGDVILSVNEAAVHDEEQLAAHLRRAEPEGPIALVIQRSEPSEDDKGTELVDYDLVLASRSIDSPEAAPLIERGDESDAAAIGRLAGVQVRSDERSLASKSRLVRIAVMAAGAAVNAVLPIGLFALAALIPQNTAAGPAVIVSVIPGGPAAEAGLLPDDRILEVGGVTVRNTRDVSNELGLALGNDVEIVVERPLGEEGVTLRGAGETSSEILTVTARARLAPPPLTHIVRPGETVFDVADSLSVSISTVQEEAFGRGLELPKGLTLTFPDGETYVTQKNDTVSGLRRELFRRQSEIIAASGLDFVSLSAGIEVQIRQGATGITIANGSFNVVRESEGFFGAMAAGWDRTIDTVLLLRNRIRTWIAGGPGIQFAGPIGIARTTGEVVEQAGWMRLIELAALLSINLAIINILPLPMLDGGRIVFVLIEIVRRGKRISPEKEGLVHLTGLALLIMFAVVVSYFDIVRAIAGESALR